MRGAALRVYAESGEQGLTVSAVTKDSGVSLGSLYHHFGSIDGLVIAAERRWVGRLLDELLTALQAAPTSRDGSEAVVRAYFAFVREHPDAAWLVHSPYGDGQPMRSGEEWRDAQRARVSALARCAAVAAARRLIRQRRPFRTSPAYSRLCLLLRKTFILVSYGPHGTAQKVTYS
ncbi:TetR/AcrR family transcriptional regulator [Streptomyces sp. NPDC002520]